jgi:hypothetical protein
VSGCPSPLVPRHLLDVHGHSCFRLVGEAYAHIVMDGEAVTDDIIWKDVCLV